MRADPLTSLLAMLTSPPRGLVSGKDEVSVPYQYLPQVLVIQKRRGYADMDSPRLPVALLVVAALSGAFAQKFDGEELKCMTKMDDCTT